MRTASVAVLVLLSALAVASQDKTTKQEKKAEEPAPVIVSRPTLPKGWKALGLTKKQTQDIYKVRTAYAAKLQKIKEEMEALRLKESADLEALLSDAQRSRLKEITKGTEGKK